MAEEVYRIEIPVRVTDQTEPGATRAQQKISKFEQSMRKTEERIQKMNRTKLQLVISAIDKASAVISYVGSKARALTSKAWRFTIGVVDLATKPLRGILNFITSIQGAITAVVAGMAAQKMIAGPMALADALAEVQVGFETMLGSADAAKKMMDDIKEFAIKTPFETFDVVTQAQRMLTYGWKPGEVLRDLERIGNVAAATGKGAEGIERIVLALGQIRMKGKLSAEELNQLAEAGVKAREYIAKGLGVSVPQAMKMVEKGMIDANKAIDLILKGMDEFAGQMDKTANKTVKGLWSQIKEAFEVNIIENWGRGLQKGAIEGLIKLNDWVDKNRQKLEEWGRILNRVGETISTAVITKIEKIGQKLTEVFNSDKFRNAETISEKLKVVWDEIVVTPFNEWWNGTGQKKVVGIAESIGRALGGGIGSFLMAVLGLASDTDRINKGINKVQESPFVQAGAKAGEAFLNAFLEAFDAQKIADKAVEAFKTMGREAGKVMPGGEEPTAASWISAGALGYLGYKGARGAIKVAKGGASIWRFFSGLFKRGGAAEAAASTAATAEAGAATAQAAAEVAKIFGPRGEVLSTVVKNADEAAKVVQATTKAGGRLSKLFSWLGKLGKGGKGVPVFGIATGLLGSITTVASAAPSQRGQEVAGEIGGWAGFAAGAALGAKAGSALGGAIGSIIPGAGTAAGAAIGGTIGTIAGGVAGSLGGEKALEWLYTQKDAIIEWGKKTGAGIGEFFTKTLPGFFTETVPEAARQAGEAIGGFFSNVGSTIGGFFTEKIPEMASTAGSAIADFASNIGNGIATFFTETVPNFFIEQIPYAIGYAIGSLQTFFTETLPTKWDEFWTSVGNFFTQTIPVWWEDVCTAVSDWWENTIVPGWQGFWNSVGGFFTETLPQWAAGVYETAMRFFTEDVPAFFVGLWGGIKGFFMETLPQWAEAAYQTAIRFFTEDVPAFFLGLWDTIEEFFTETLPTWVEGAWYSINEFFTETIPGFLASLWGNVVTLVTEKIPEKAREIKDKVLGWFGSIGEWIKNIWDRISSSFKAGYEAGRGTGVNVAQHADGGILTRPHLGLVAEAGAEAIIPLSRARRQRGLEVWEQAGRILGVIPYAQGGIAGDTDTATTTPIQVYQPRPKGQGQTIVINVNANPAYEIKAATSAEDVLAVIRQHESRLAEEIGEEIAEKLAAIFGNMPVAEGA